MKVPNEVLNLMEKLDSTTYNHSYRLWELAIGLEEYFNHEDSDLSTAALLHDIGKLYVLDSILDKRGGLSTLEREVIDFHPYYGYRILYAFGVKEEVRRMSVEQACNWMEQEQGYHTETLVYLRNYAKDFTTV